MFGRENRKAKRDAEHFNVGLPMVKPSEDLKRGLRRRRQRGVSHNNEEIQAQNLRCAYDCERLILKEFLDWRHKVMVFAFTSGTGLAAIGAWMYDHKVGALVALPFAIGSLIALTSIGMDARLQGILAGCYERGRVLAIALGLPNGGPFGSIPIKEKTWRHHIVSFHFLLKLSYGVLAAAYLVVAAWMLMNSPTS